MVRSVVKRVEKRRSHEDSKEEEMKKKKVESCKILLMKGRNGQDLIVQEWLQKNYEEV